MSRYDEVAVLNLPIIRKRGTLTVNGVLYAGSRCMLYLDGALCVPMDDELRQSIYALLGRGERVIVLDLTRVSRIDAAGVGELVHAYNVASAAQTTLQIVHAPPWVRKILERAGLFQILSGGRTQPVTASSK
jgi:anti-sigma B factor antagonist